MFSPIICYDREGSILWQRKRKRSIFTARILTRFWMCSSPEKGCSLCYWSLWHMKLLNTRKRKVSVLIWKPKRPLYIQPVINWALSLIWVLLHTSQLCYSEPLSLRIQKYPSSSSLQQLLYSLLVHTVIRFKNYTVFNTIFISNWNCCLFLFRWKSLHKVCKPGKATWWSIVCEETEYSR